MGVFGSTTDYTQLSPGQPCKFLAMRHLGMTDDMVTVSWLDSPTASERKQWRYPLPPKPVP
jgi:hypothetical protein